METPRYIQIIDSSRSLAVIDAHWSTAVIAISLILHSIPQKIIGLEPEAAEYKQFQRGRRDLFRVMSFDSLQKGLFEPLRLKIQAFFLSHCKSELKINQ